MDHVDVTFQIESAAFATGHAAVVRMCGKEAISQLYWFDVEVRYPTDHAPQPDAIRGASITLIFFLSDIEVRRVHGMVSRVDQFFGTDPNQCRFKLHIVPRAHRLTLVKMQDIFIKKTVVDLVVEKFGLMGLSNAQCSVSRLGDYPVRDFVVQYGETDMAFINRLTEHYGISYFFEQDGEDNIQFCESNAFPSDQTHKPLELVKHTDAGGIQQLARSREVMPETYWVMDYNYSTPNVELSAQASREDGYAGGVFDYGDHFMTPTEGQHLANVRAQEYAASYNYYHGTSDYCYLSVGHRFDMGTPEQVGCDNLLMVELSHNAVAGDHGTTSLRYSNKFTAVAHDTTYCPPRRTPKPVIAGVMNGVVEKTVSAGFKGNDALDSQGLYLVKFMFDTSKPGERDPSKPVRLARTTAGAGYGMHFPLREGTEVLLSFVNGDPDRPIIVSAMHTDTTPAPLTDVDPQFNVIRSKTGINMVFKDNA